MRARRTLSLFIGIALLGAACSSVVDSVEATGTPTESNILESDDNPVTESEPPSDPDDALREPQSLPAFISQLAFMWNTDWSRTTIDLSDLVVGIGAIDPRDIITPIDAPIFGTLAEASEFVADREPGALVQVGDESRFYPLSILTRHEIVNDQFGDIPVAVTYCPLCNTAVTWDRRIGDDVVRLGVSGLLRNSDMVMWDDKTDSLWQQITGEAIVGQFAGTRLEPISTAIVSLGDVKENFPEAIALAADQGFGRGYGANLYAGYSSRPTPYPGFAAAPTDDRFPALDRVVGVTIDDQTKAYPFRTLVSTPVVNDEVGGEPIVVFWGGDTADALDTSLISEAAAVGTGVAYLRRVGGEVLTFTSNADDTFTDLQTGSKWSVLGVATQGPLEGQHLELVPHRNEFWFAFTAFFPDADVHED